MGRGDRRNSLKMKRRRAQRKKKARIKRMIEGQLVRKKVTVNDDEARMNITA